MTAAGEAPLTPCINICTLDAAGQICTGCYRSLDEIMRWSQLDQPTRAEIMAALPERAASYLDLHADPDPNPHAAS